MKLEDISTYAWLQEYQIKAEQGQLIDFKNHAFLFHPYADLSPNLAILKAAQIGFSTLAILKSLWVAKKMGLDIIYTLPTEDDRNEFVGGKVNRIIAQNPIIQQYVKDKDTIEQKRVGDNIIYYRGTWTKKAAIMVSSDLNIYDEVDASKADVIEQYSTRLQHSDKRWEWYFSHPSSEGFGVDKYWQLSDQKHWFIRCNFCNKRQFLHWPDSVDADRRIFICKYCKSEFTDTDRRRGEWVVKYRDRTYSGYWIPLLICPWITAGNVIDYFNNKSEEYFYNKVLGLPYIGGGNKLTKALFIRNLSEDEGILPGKNERIVIGVDTGVKIHWIAGGPKGIFAYAEENDYTEIDNMLTRWPRSIAVIDQGGDLIGSRKLREKYPGRVYLCSYGADRKTGELVRWGQKDEYGVVVADRNRMIQLVVDEFTDQRIPVYGTENDWFDYWLHWNNLTRIKEEDERGMIKRIWVRSGPDHWAHATTYWRVGMMRFASAGDIIKPKTTQKAPLTYSIRPDKKVEFNPLEGQFEENKHDWRD